MSDSNSSHLSVMKRSYHRHVDTSYLPPSLAVRSYDGDSGLVYSETEVSGGGSNSGWVVEYKTPNIVRKRLRPNHGKGSRSLADMALIKLGFEAQELTVESLQSLPWVFGERIWKQIMENHAESFYLWRTFATAYGADFASSNFRYMLDIKSPSLALNDYYKGINSKKREWLTCLRISPKQVSVPDLVSLSSISNLTVLDLSDGQLYIENRESTFDMRVLRSWAELARAGRAFRNLHVLMLGWQEKVDVWMFELLDAFPRLNIAVMTDCRLIHHKNHKDWEEAAWAYGWEFLPSKRGVKELRSLMDDRTFHRANVSVMHKESQRVAAESALKQVDDPDLPLLECWLGSPRTWSHIIDEFPGTKTVYLQKTGVPRQNVMQHKPASGDGSCSRPRPRPRDSTTIRASERNQNSSPTRRRRVHRSATNLLAEMM